MSAHQSPVLTAEGAAFDSAVNSLSGDKNAGVKQQLFTEIVQTTLLATAQSGAAPRSSHASPEHSQSRTKQLAPSKEQQQQKETYPTHARFQSRSNSQPVNNIYDFLSYQNNNNNTKPKSGSALQPPAANGGGVRKTSLGPAAPVPAPAASGSGSRPTSRSNSMAAAMTHAQAAAAASAIHQQNQEKAAAAAAAAAAAGPPPMLPVAGAGGKDKEKEVEPPGSAQGDISSDDDDEYDPDAKSETDKIDEKMLRRRQSSDLGASVLISKLVGGGIFLKHGASGKPHYRFVWCDENLLRVQWSELSSKTVKGYIDVRTITEVSTGHATKTFKRAPKTSNPDRCFSIGSSVRTLDLEAISAQECGLWVLTFHFLVEYAKRKENANKYFNPTASPHTSTNGAAIVSSPNGGATATASAAHSHARSASISSFVDPSGSVVNAHAAAAVTAMGGGDANGAAALDGNSNSAVLTKILETAASATAGEPAGPTPNELKWKGDYEHLSKRLKEATSLTAKLQRLVDKFEGENRLFYIKNSQFKIDNQELRAEVERLRAENKRLRSERKRRGSQG